MKKVTVIGSGLIGLSAAYYLTEAGYEVTVLDRGSEDNCSFGNAGMIVPSHFIPLAAPGMISKGIKWMFDKESPFYVKPRLNRSLWSWGLKFIRHANHAHVYRSAPALKSLSLFSKDLLEKMITEHVLKVGYRADGLLMLYKSKEAEQEEKHTLALAKQYGIEAHILSLNEIQALEKNTTVNVRGGIFFPGDAHLDPRLYTEALIQLLQKRGVTICRNCQVRDITIADGKITSLITDDQLFQSDEYILAAGAASELLAKKIRHQLPLQGGKGYSFLLAGAGEKIRIPSILLEGRVAVTPMGNELRLGGTMEISGNDLRVNMKRVQGIIRTVPEYFPELEVALPEQENVWSGLRPCPPDGLPYIGRPRKIKNLVIATGHSMLGLSLSNGTGKIVEQLISGVVPEIDITAFSPDRFV